VRFREVGGILGEPAIILDDLPAESAAPRIRIGRDGALYAGTVAVDPRDSEDLGSYAGKILRFTTDGATPADNPRAPSPVFSSGHTGRLDFDWEPGSEVMWSVGMNEAGVSLERTGSEESEGGSDAFLEGIQSVAAAFYTGSTPAAWKNSLFLASANHQCLYRVSGLSSVANGGASEPKVERLLAGTYGRISAVLSSDEGLYFATANGGRDENGQPADAVFLIREMGMSNIPAPRGSAVIR